MSYPYPTETVDCPGCDGSGYDDPYGDRGDGFGRCLDCGGVGSVDVCANCLDDPNGCAVCAPDEY